MPTYSANKKYAEKYLAKMDEIRIRMTKESGLKEAIQAHAEERGESVQAFILRAITEAINRDARSCQLDGEPPKLLQEKDEGTDTIKHPLIGKRVFITDKNSWYHGEWGIVAHYDGELFHVRIANGNSMPAFDRKQFRVPRNTSEGTVD